MIQHFLHPKTTHWLSTRTLYSWPSVCQIGLTMERILSHFINGRLCCLLWESNMCPRIKEKIYSMVSTIWSVFFTMCKFRAFTCWLNSGILFSLFRSSFDHNLNCFTQLSTHDSDLKVCFQAKVHLYEKLTHANYLFVQ